jgi:hypothetical protein
LIALIRRLLSLVLLALVANGTWHLFLAYSAHFKFRDAVEYAAQNRGEKSDEDLRQQIEEIAADADVPLQPERLAVTHQGIATEVSAAYTRPVELFPGRPYGWSFSFRVDTFVRQPPNTVKSP